MNYEIKFGDFADNEIALKVVDLQNAVYANRGTSATKEGMAFWFLQNPCGKVISFNAFCGDIIAAQYSLIPYKMCIEGKETLGLLSMATVTHPEHRGKGLFKLLAQKTYDYAAQNGYQFVIGVANANSFPGFMKYFNFTFVSRLDVKWGWGKISIPQGKTFFSCMNRELFNWRFSKPFYRMSGNSVYGKHGKVPLIKTYMGVFPEEIMTECHLLKPSIFRPFNLYVGLGADLSKGHYFNFPKFVKHSPFNLIFMDLTGGKLPTPTKDNILFQLSDFDVA